jgi:hypothetical protein
MRIPPLFSIDERGTGCFAAAAAAELSALTSVNVFQPPHEGQRPSHLDSSCAHERHLKRVLDFIGVFSHRDIRAVAWNSQGGYSCASMTPCGGNRR